MEQLTAEGLKVAGDLAQRHGFSQDAVIHMMFAMLKGRGGMAQFNHPEFGGSGQWMKGGMLMTSDLFNHALKARIGALCDGIATLLDSQPHLFPAGSFQAQSQSGGGQHQQVAPLSMGGSPLFTPDPRDNWWPPELGTPQATGSQNETRYAYFANPGRLAVEVNGQVGVYDTGDQAIGGFSQQQSGGGGVVFRTPGGSVSLSSLSPLSGMAHQMQQTGTGGQQQQSSVAKAHPMPSMAPMAGMAPMTPMTFATPASSGAAAPTSWWGRGLGTPAATGSQNDLRYACFPDSHRLAVERNGRVQIHDTGEHVIVGVSQQGADGELVVSTPNGPMPLAHLPTLPRADDAPPPAQPPSQAQPQPPVSRESEVLSALERLGELKSKGLLTEAEFSAKKTELLSRL